MSAHTTLIKREYDIPQHAESIHPLVSDWPVIAENFLCDSRNWKMFINCVPNNDKKVVLIPLSGWRSLIALLAWNKPIYIELLSGDTGYSKYMQVSYYTNADGSVTEITFDQMTFDIITFKWITNSTDHIQTALFELFLSQWPCETYKEVFKLPGLVKSAYKGVALLS